MARELQDASQDAYVVVLVFFIAGCCSAGLAVFIFGDFGRGVGVGGGGGPSGMVVTASFGLWRERLASDIHTGQLVESNHKRLKAEQ